MKKGLKLALALIMTSSFLAVKSISQTSITNLWNAYKANPYNHPNLPNNSYAGYGTGITTIPDPAYTIYNVTSVPYNAIANDANDDQPAIQAAIDAAGAAGSGIVYIPAGTFVLNKPLYIKYNNVIVRGQGSTGGSATILDFRFSIYSMYKADIDPSFVGPGGLWWAGGLVWIGPGDTFKANGAPDMYQDYEQWRSTTTLATVTASSDPGTFSITVGSTASLSVGMRVLLRYTMPTDNSFIKHIHGHTASESQIDGGSGSVVGDCSNIKAPGEPYYYWPAVISAISGTTVTFDRPLRLKVDPVAWPAVLRNISSVITESGLENVQLRGHNTTSMGHLVTPTSSAVSGTATLGGWNGVYLNRSWNCWVNNVRTVDMECGFIFAAAKNCSVLNTYATSTTATHWYHHPYAVRVYSSDNLVEEFTVDGPSAVRHGINAEWYSSGNVYSRGTMKVGTFDTHRGSAFDLIRTEITIANDNASRPGGATTSGPFAGKRFANWYVTQKIWSGYTYQDGASRGGEDIYEPLQFPMGALVAITGPRSAGAGEFIPTPVSGSIGQIEITDSIVSSSLRNLYHAQLEERIGNILPIHLISFNVLKSIDRKAFINWTVADPETGDRFVLQGSDDGRNFSDIFFLNAAVNKTNYSYDHRVSNWNHDQYFRLKIISGSGETLYSDIKLLKADRNTDKLSVYPNPITDKLVVNFNGLGLRKVRIINSSGQVVRTIENGNGMSTITIGLNGLIPGQYYIEAISADGVFKRSFIKQ